MTQHFHMQYNVSEILGKKWKRTTEAFAYQEPCEQNGLRFLRRDEAVGPEISWM